MTKRIASTSGGAQEPHLVPIVEIPNPEWVTWQQTGPHDEGAEPPAEWLTLSIDRSKVDGSAMLRFMRESRGNPYAATYDLLELAFGAAQLRLLEQARMSPQDLVEVAALVADEFTTT